jgi:peptidyl-prolyl cis-trans isomerase SurA
MILRLGLAGFATVWIIAAPPALAQQDESELTGGFFAPNLHSLDAPPDTPPEPSRSEVLIEGIAAQVGTSIVLVSEVQRLSAPIEARMLKAGAPASEIREMRVVALDRLIEERLIDNVVSRYQMAATDAEINDAIAAKAQENGLTVEKLRQSIASHGLTFEEYRTQIKNLIERQRVLGSIVRSRVDIDEAEIEALYQQQYANQRDSGSEIHLQHLLIGVSAEKMRDQKTACRIAGDIRDEIVTGKLTFSKAAERFSDTNAERGGDLGWVHADELAGWMAPALESLEASQVSGVISMPFGCNLLLVVDRREVQPVSFDQARPAIEQGLFAQKMEQEYQAWIEKMREQIYVKRKGTYAEATRLQDRTPQQ